MSEKIGNITIPAPLVTSSVFPIQPDYPYSVEIATTIYTHTFGVLGARQEQRFYGGDGARKFTIRRNALTLPQRDAFITFWLANQGGYGQFPFNAPNPDGSTTRITCRFADPHCRSMRPWARLPPSG